MKSVQNFTGTKKVTIKFNRPSPRHLLHPSPLRQLPHRQRRHRLQLCRNPRLGSPPRVSRKLHEGYVETPRRKRGETRAMSDASREYTHRHGLLPMMEHAALVSMLVICESTKNIVHQHSAPQASKDLPTAHASDFSTSSRVFDIEKSFHVD